MAPSPPPVREKRTLKPTEKRHLLDEDEDHIDEDAPVPKKPKTTAATRVRAIPTSSSRQILTFAQAKTSSKAKAAPSQSKAKAAPAAAPKATPSQPSKSSLSAA